MYVLFFKRALDLVFSLLFLLLLAPLLLALCLWIKLDSPGPVFFRQKRVGRGKRYFFILKFPVSYTHLTLPTKA